MKKKILTAAVLSVAFIMGGCSSGTVSTVTSTAAEANPWEDYATLDEAQEAVGFEISVPDMSGYGSGETYRVCAALSEVEIRYGDENTFIRKADDDGDISGDYSEYAYEEDAQAGDSSVTLKGESSDNVKLAVWISGNYSYCVKIGEGVQSETMIELVSLVE